MHDCPHIMISALDGQNVDVVIDWIRSYSLKILSDRQGSIMQAQIENIRSLEQPQYVSDSCCGN